MTGEPPRDEDPDPLRAWSYLSCDPAYRADWRARAAPTEYERDAPFPVRIQTEADRVAVARWSLLAWQDPFDGTGPLSAFFSDVPMLDGTGSASVPPLLPLPRRPSAIHSLDDTTARGSSQPRRRYTSSVSKAMGPRQISSVRIASTGMVGRGYSGDVKGKDIEC